MTTIAILGSGALLISFITGIWATSTDHDEEGEPTTTLGKWLSTTCVLTAILTLVAFVLLVLGTFGVHIAVG